MQSPKVPLRSMETLWLQVAGTECNLVCRHCFLSCGPAVRRHTMMSRRKVGKFLDEAKKMGAKEVYLTGGEPFLNPEIIEIIGDALDVGSVTVLTNGTLVTSEVADCLDKLRHQARHPLNIRVSLESVREKENDHIRGAGNFRRAEAALTRLIERGFNPILAITCEVKPCARQEVTGEFERFLRARGVAEPRIKFLPIVLLGRQADNVRPYSEHERVTEKCFENFDMANLQCSSCRIVTARGVFACPILIDDPNARMGETLEQSRGEYAMTSGACYTCRTTGLRCGN